MSPGKGGAERERARELYVRGFGIEEIARVVSKSEATVYRWKDAAAREGHCWDEALRVAKLSPLALKERYFNVVQRVIAKAEEDEEFAKSGAFADSLAKHMKNLKALTPDFLKEGAVLDFIKITSLVLSERAPEVQKGFIACAVHVRNRLLEYVHKGSV